MPLIEQEQNYTPEQWDILCEALAEVPPQVFEDGFGGTMTLSPWTVVVEIVTGTFRKPKQIGDPVYWYQACWFGDPASRWMTPERLEEVRADWNKRFLVGAAAGAAIAWRK